MCEHLHLPLQSGSDRVLAAMHRGYTAERYLEKLAAARAAIADLAVTTDIIVGFPGETDDDFADTLEVAAEADYDSRLHVHLLAPTGHRGGRRAPTSWSIPTSWPSASSGCALVVERSGARRHEARVGRVEEVVVEGPSKRDPAVLTGRTRQNKLVHFPSGPIRVGTYAEVRVTGAGAHSLRGELVEIVAPATHRTRIPVLAG